MKKLLIHLLLLCPAVFGQAGHIIGGGMVGPTVAAGGVAFVQSAKNNVTSATTTITVGNGVGTGWSTGNVHSGDTLFVGFVSFNPSTLSATDTLGTSFTCAILGPQNSFYIGYCHGKPTTSGADEITMTAGLSIAPTVVALEFSGLASTVDGTISSNALASSTTWTLPGITTTNANDAVIGCGGTNSTNDTYTAGSGYTIPSNGQASGGNQSAFCEYQVVSSASTYTPTATLSTATTGIGGIFAFK